jgi:hypothetical protein
MQLANPKMEIIMTNHGENFAICVKAKVSNITLKRKKTPKTQKVHPRHSSAIPINSFIVNIAESPFLQYLKEL